MDKVGEWHPLALVPCGYDCIARVIARIEPTKMAGCFIAWVQGIAELTTGEVVAVDGKTARHSYNRRDKLGAIHMVSAWANQAGLSLGQVKTEAKSNEITAIPALLDMLEIKGCIITTDAMGCQTDIAEKIVEKQADYVLAVKDNQKFLHEAIADYFEVAITANNPALCLLQTHEETHPGHGCIETRRCYLATCLDTLPDVTGWKELKSIGMVESERFIKESLNKSRIPKLTDGFGFFKFLTPFDLLFQAACRVFPPILGGFTP